MPTAHSLKEKRSLLKGPLERVKGRFNVSIIEASGNDGWQRATLTAACVGDGEELVRSELEKVGEHFERADGLVVLDTRFELL